MKATGRPGSFRAGSFRGVSLPRSKAFIVGMTAVAMISAVIDLAPAHAIRTVSARHALAPRTLATRTLATSTFSGNPTDGIVTGSGAAQFLGSPGSHARSPLAGIAGRPDGTGYWVLRSDGYVYNYGNAAPLGWPPLANFGMKAVGIAPSPDGAGYWIVTANGVVFGYGSAANFGHPATLGSAVTGLAATPTGAGYWIVASDGGVFAYGDAHFFGSAFGFAGPNGGAVAIAATPSGHGYWVVTRNGAVLTYGDAANLGNPWPSSTAVVGIAPTRSGSGYALLFDNGKVKAYGDANPSVARSLVRGHTIRGPRDRIRFLPTLGNSADVAGQVHSVVVAIDRHSVAIAPASGFHSFWILNAPLRSHAVIAAVGARGSKVRSIQYNLIARGYWLNVNSNFDTVTQQAVWAFQKALRRPRTGWISAGDYRKLIRSARPRALSTSGYVIELDKTRQIMMVTNNGHVDWIFNTSTGTEKPYVFAGVTSIAHTPTGRFRVLGQVDGLQKGRLGSLWRPKYFTSDGIAFHGSANIPPFPASHGCSRLSNSAIDFLWATNALPLGTAVWVY